MALSHKTPLWFIEAIVLDIISIPSKFMSKKQGAKWHLKYVCPHCSKHRKMFRDPKGGVRCMWHKAWAKKDYKMCRDFGFINWIRYYFGRDTDLKEFERVYEKTMRELEKTNK